MAQTAWIFSYKLRKNVSEEVFIERTQKLHDEVISKAKGFISWEHYVQDSVWRMRRTPRRWGREKR